jgi:hypothetical protein
LARGWAISGIDDRTREAANAAADGAGMPVGAWVERALRQALEAKKAEPEPARPQGVELGELEAMVRQVVAEELRPVKEALDRLETRAMVPNPAGGGPVTLMRERRWQRRR